MKELTTEELKELQQLRAWALDAAIADVNAAQNLAEARSVERLIAILPEAELRQNQAEASWNRYVQKVRELTDFDYVIEIAKVQIPSEIDVIRKGEGGR